ncbi:MAG: transglycosylase SLT domain-containing protein [Chitinophagales bacterium]
MNKKFLPVISEKKINVNLKGASFLVMIVVLTNFLTFSLFNNKPVDNLATSIQESAKNHFYLLDQAAIYVHNTSGFEKKVRKTAQRLNVPAEWLMAAMYSESKFDASAINSKSSAIGLIQFTPSTAKSLDITIQKLRNMNHIEQMDYVYDYLNGIQKKHKSFDNLTELYLGILYPEALGEDYCYTLYAKPSATFERNKILDEDKDGRVTVKDINDRMKRMFPTAYMLETKPKSSWFWFMM